MASKARTTALTLMPGMLSPCADRTYIVKAYIAMAYIVMAYIAMAYIVMAYMVMAYIVMAYIVMASQSSWVESSPPMCLRAT